MIQVPSVSKMWCRGSSLINSRCRDADSRALSLVHSDHCIFLRKILRLTESQTELELGKLDTWCPDWVVISWLLQLLNNGQDRNLGVSIGDFHKCHRNNFFSRTNRRKMRHHWEKRMGTLRELGCVRRPLRRMPCLFLTIHEHNTWDSQALAPNWAVPWKYDRPVNPQHGLAKRLVVHLHHCPRSQVTSALAYSEEKNVFPDTTSHFSWRMSLDLPTVFGAIQDLLVSNVSTCAIWSALFLILWLVQ